MAVSTHGSMGGRNGLEPTPPKSQCFAREGKSGIHKMNCTGFGHIRQIAALHGALAGIMGSFSYLCKPMLYTVLNHITTQLNTHLRQHLQLAEDIAVLSNVVALDGSIEPATVNKVVLFLTHWPAATALQATSDAPQLSVQFMCAAHFSGNNYPEALKMLAASKAFFDENPVLTSPSAHELHITVESPSSEQMAQLWQAHGGTYLPSLLYRLQALNPSV